MLYLQAKEVMPRLSNAKMKAMSPARRGASLLSAPRKWGQATDSSRWQEWEPSKGGWEKKETRVGVLFQKLRGSRERPGFPLPVPPATMDVD